MSKVLARPTSGLRYVTCQKNIGLITAWRPGIPWQIYSERRKRSTEFESALHIGSVRRILIPSMKPEDIPSNRPRLHTETEVPKAPDIELDADQKFALELIKQGRNVFITGAAGSGKSEVIRRAVQYFENASKVFHVTAPTAFAAKQLQGRTIHRWFGPGRLNKGINEIIKNLGPQPIQDIHDACKKAEFEDDRFFGGMQVIVCGDFFQLPPVNNINELENCVQCVSLTGFQIPDANMVGRKYLDTPPKHQSHEAIGLIPNRWSRCPNKQCGAPFNDSIKYVFQTKEWKEAAFVNVYLKEVHRQTDQEWIKILNQIRLGSQDEEVIDYLQKLQRKLPEHGDIKPTKINTHRKGADEENQREYGKLVGNEYCSDACDAAEERSEHWFFKDNQMPSSLCLKLGTQVMLIANINADTGLVNGSRGVILDDGKAYNIYFNNQPALKDKTELLKEFYNSHCSEGKISLPIVRFEDQMDSPYVITPFLNNTKTRNINMQERLQIPLTHAWAITVHKSQGLTLDYAAVNIGRAFTTGQTAEFPEIFDVERAVVERAFHEPAIMRSFS
ncbi:P-loop containing nucleoside triphosphate hydrolase protein [Pyronema omphalodes]|nr:P-loop containing nucleoside triphosphate hydrolase protein [Pyronema omphalodes]